MQTRQSRVIIAEICNEGERELESVKMRLIGTALSRYHTIFPCGQNTTLDECFSFLGTTLVFWFNTADHKTHVTTYRFDKQAEWCRSIPAPPGQLD
jgi:hypothetical protein